MDDLGVNIKFPRPLWDAKGASEGRALRACIPKRSVVLRVRVRG